MYQQYLIAFLLLLAALPGYGQEQDKRVYADVGIAAGFAHTGYHTSLLFPVHYGRHSAYVGPKLLLTESYLPYRNIWGVHAGYGYRVLTAGHWYTDAGLDYQCSFYKPYSVTQHNRYNHIQELYLLLGLAYRIRPEGRLSIKMQLGSGIYADTWQDLVEGRKRTGLGRASTGRFTVSYKLF